MVMASITATGIVQTIHNVLAATAHSSTCHFNTYFLLHRASIE